MDIVTLNLMGQASVPRRIRYAPLVSFLDNQRPDVVLFQEGIGGLAHGTCSSIKDINRALDHPYYVTTATMTHWSAYAICHYDLGVLTRSKPLKVLTSNLDTARGAKSMTERLIWSSGARALAVLVPTENGKVWVVSIHLDGTQGSKGFAKQADELNELIRSMRRDCQAIVLGGDFNYDLRQGDHPVHDMLTYINDLIDLPTGPTYALLDNPFITSAWPKRLDYFYVTGAIPVHCDVVFNTPGGFVSDHCGVKASMVVRRQA